MKEAERLRKRYEWFCSREGNEFIASEYAILKIQQLIRRFRVSNVLELGLGIGSISGTLLYLNKQLNYWGTEDQEFCLKALEENLEGNFQRIRLFSRIEDLPAANYFDMVIIDAKVKNLIQVSKLIKTNGIIVVEGDRMDQQAAIQELFKKNLLVHAISLKKNSAFSPFDEEAWQGGIKIIFVNPTLGQKLWWAKEKIYTKLKYQYPGRHFGEKFSFIK